MVVVPVILSMQEILNNEGEQQLIDVFDAYIEAARVSAWKMSSMSRMYSDGLANGGKQTNRAENGGADHRQCQASMAVSTAQWRPTRSGARLRGMLRHRPGRRLAGDHTGQLRRPFARCSTIS